MPDHRRNRLHTAAALLVGRSLRPFAALAGLAMLAGLVALAVQVRGFTIVVALVTWPAIGVAWRAAVARAGLPEEPWGAAPYGTRLAEIAAEEAAALGAEPPDAIVVTAGRDITLHRHEGRRILAAGLLGLAERSPAQTRIGVAEAIGLDADAPGRRLEQLANGPVDRALTIAEEHPLLSLPWSWYAVLVARRLRAARRRRHLTLDATLAERHGSAAAIPHVRAWAWEPGFEVFWARVVVPCLRRGFRPPIVEGWRRVIVAPGALEEYAEHVGDTPPDRLAAVRAAGPGTRPDADEAPVLGDPVDDLEARVLSAREPGALVPLSWERVADAVLLPVVRAGLARQDWLANATVADLADLVQANPERAEALEDALLVALADDGWTVAVDPVWGVTATRGASVAEPFGIAEHLAGAEPEQWREFAAREGVADLPLLPASAEAEPDEDLEALAAAPPAGRVELVLRGSRRLRARALAVVIPAAGLALPLAILSIVTSLAAADDPAIRWVMLGIGAFLALGVGGLCWGRLRLAFGRGRVVLDGDRLWIEHPALLKRAYELPRAQVRAAVADRERGRRDAAGRPVRFPLAVTPWDDPHSARAGAVAWLWAAGEIPGVPFLGVEADAPNLALVFREPVEGPAVRRQRLHGPLKGEAIGGLLLTVEAPGDLERRLHALGFAPQLGPEDVNVLHEAFEGPERAAIPA